MHIVMFDSMLEAGGAERVLVTMANNLVTRHDVTIVTFCKEAGDVFYEINSDVRMEYLNQLGASTGLLDAIRQNVRRILVLRESIRRIKPDIIISFLPENNVLVTLSCFGLKIPIVATEHTDPFGTKLGRAWDILRTCVYRRVDAIVVLNRLAKEYFVKRFNAPVIVIPNPIFLPAEKEEAEKLKVSSPYIITIGRLVKNKRIEDVISAFSQLESEFKAWQLIIVGDGPLKEELQGFANQLGVSERVVFTGLVLSPASLLKHAEMFVSASITEVFPMAICEAMACGLPVVARKYNESIRDIIDDSETGVLVDIHSQDDLVTAMKGLMDDQERRKNMGKKAKVAMRKYSLDAIMSEWTKLFDQLEVKTKND